MSFGDPKRLDDVSVSSFLCKTILLPWVVHTQECDLRNNSIFRAMQQFRENLFRRLAGVRIFCLKKSLFGCQPAKVIHDAFTLEFLLLKQAM